MVASRSSHLPPPVYTRQRVAVELRLCTSHWNLCFQRSEKHRLMACGIKVLGRTAKKYVAKVTGLPLHNESVQRRAIYVIWTEQTRVDVQILQDYISKPRSKAVRHNKWVTALAGNTERESPRGRHKRGEVLSSHAMKVHGRNRGTRHTFVTSALDRVARSKPSSDLFARME